jgi:hypothetical protein
MLAVQVCDASSVWLTLLRSPDNCDAAPSTPACILILFKQQQQQLRLEPTPEHADAAATVPGSALFGAACKEIDVIALSRSQRRSS